jgi:D-aminopeptidase
MLWVQRPDDYAKGRESLTSDVNAAIRGLVAGGAGPIWIQDRHGSGNVNEPDLLVDKMDQSASLTGCRCISRKSIRKREASAFGHARNAARDARMRRA